MDSQRPILYLALFFALFLIWQAWQKDYGPQPTPAQIAEVSPDAPTDTAPQDIPAAPASPQAAPVTPAATAAAVEPSKQVRVVTDVLDVVIDTRGGDIRRAELPTYPVSLKTPDVPMRLFDDTERLYLAQCGLISSASPERAPNHHSIYAASETEYRLPAGRDVLVVPLSWTGPDGTAVTKTYTFRRGSFLIDVEHVVRNGAPEPWLGRAYYQLRHGPVRDEDQSRLVYTYTGTAYYDGKYEKLPFDKMADEPLSKDITGGWAAVLQHYFFSAWIPPQDQLSHYYSKVLTGGPQTEYLIGLQSPAKQITAGAEDRFATQLYVGPKLQEEIGSIAEGLDLTVDYGFFTILAKPLFLLLEFIHDLIGNWGWAIVVVTILIKLVFYKLSETSYRSMARMRQVQPKLVALKERYADDKQRMNQALMELYKKEKINPLGGCLPILIQIPVFIAFYWMLLESVEMRQAPWILWIDDLSTKDPYFVLPVLMGITMIVQHKLNPAPLDPLQQKITMIMPIAFTVFFAFFPSGLVLYWFVNNLLSIAQQWVITRRIERGAKD